LGSALPGGIPYSLTTNNNFDANAATLPLCHLSTIYCEKAVNCATFTFLASSAFSQTPQLSFSSLWSRSTRFDSTALINPSALIPCSDLFLSSSIDCSALHLTAPPAVSSAFSNSLFSPSVSVYASFMIVLSLPFISDVFNGSSLFNASFLGKATAQLNGTVRPAPSFAVDSASNARTLRLQLSRRLLDLSELLPSIPLLPSDFADFVASVAFTASASSGSHHFNCDSTFFRTTPDFVDTKQRSPPQSFTTTPVASGSESALIMAGIAGAVAVFVAILVIVVIALRKRRFLTSETGSDVQAPPFATSEMATISILNTSPFTQHSLLTVVGTDTAPDLWNTAADEGLGPPAFRPL
jgi:hypothetical protein